MSNQMIFLCSGFVHWLEKRQMPCFYKSLLGVDCPGCGMQRAMIALLKGDFVGSLKLYPALVPTIVMLAFLGVHIFRPLKNGARILLWMFVFNIVIIVTSYICKIIV